MSSADVQASGEPRYVVGIDLGTTNSAVTCVDTWEDPWRVRTFPIPQIVAPGVVEKHDTLPSFHYEPASGEFANRAFQLPFGGEPPSGVVGRFARDHGALVPGRLVVSAKSWLCHSGVDRTAPLLPWHGASDVTKLSPVDVSSRYLEHIRAAWDAEFPRAPLADQDIVLTLPASFDEVARELTVKAAARAGLPRLALIEEPQAAFYAWIDRHRHDWQRLVSPGQKILVCDIGGGTSDFTLIRVRAESSGKVRFHRVAVGEHLILGGDNLDLALAHHLEKRFSPEGRLEPRVWAVLVRTCRQVKETLLGKNAPETLTVSLPGKGARLVAGARQIDLTRDEVRNLLVEGFFPKTGLEDRPAVHQSGFREFGLPYAPDPAITRYLAAFLTAHRHVALEDVELAAGQDPARPDIVLLNGGVFESDVLRLRLLEVLSRWFSPAGVKPPWTPLSLDNDRLDLAVARGAAYYGMVRRGRGERISAGLARSYFIGVASDPPAAVCLIPAGVEPGEEIELGQRPMDLIVSQPVEFPLYVSSTRLADAPGEIVAVDREQMTPLPPIRTVLQTRKKSAETTQVALHGRLTEIGTLDLWCSQIEGPGRWRLQFDVRSATQTDVVAHQAVAEQRGFVEESVWSEVEAHLLATFAAEAKSPPAGLMKRLTAAIEANRRLWPPSLLRRIWETLVETEAGRRRSAEHEARWLNLLGFALRPGYGMAMDDWRVAETWRLLQGNLVHAAPMCRAEWWILWRRIGAGLTAGQQQALVDPVIGSLRAMVRQAATGKGRGSELAAGAHEAAEIWRLLGSLELLPCSLKIELGRMLIELTPRRRMESIRPAALWTLGRLGARCPLYGPLNSVVPSEAASEWLGELLKLDYEDEMAQFAVMQLARRTDDRYRDIGSKLHAKAVAWLERRGAGSHYVELVEKGGQLDEEEEGLVFGEALPIGLRIGQ